MYFGLLFWSEAVWWLFDGVSSGHEGYLMLDLVSQTHVVFSPDEYCFVLLKQVGNSLALCRLRKYTAGLGV